MSGKTWSGSGRLAVLPPVAGPVPARIPDGDGRTGDAVAMSGHGPARRGHRTAAATPP